MTMLAEIVHYRKGIEMKKSNWKRIGLFILMFPVMIPVCIIVGIALLVRKTCEGVEYILTGEINNSGFGDW